MPFDPSQQRRQTPHRAVLGHVLGTRIDHQEIAARVAGRDLVGADAEARDGTNVLVAAAAARAAVRAAVEGVGLVGLGTEGRATVEQSVRIAGAAGDSAGRNTEAAVSER